MSKLEISYTHLLNWVVARGDLPQDYAIKLLNLEEYCKVYFINNDCLPSSIKILFVNKQHEYIEWYDELTNIFNILKENDELNKLNFIGQYQYEPLYNANKLIMNFDRYNLHIASYYQLLYKYVNYYIPYLRKSIQDINHEIMDCKDREADSTKKLKRMSTELENKLTKYNLKLSDYPFNEGVQLSLYNSVQEQLLLNAIYYTKDIYNRSFLIIQSLYPMLQQILLSFMNYQKMDNMYSIDNSLRYIRHASKHSLNDFSLASKLNSNICSSLYYDSRDIIGYKYTSSDPYTDEHNTNEDILIYNGIIQLDKNEYDILFNTFLGNPICRNLLLSDINEISIFVRVRLHQLKSSFARDVLVNNNQDDVFKVNEELYKEFELKLDELFRLLSGNETIKVQSLLKNRNKLTETVKDEIKLWNCCCNETIEQSSLKHQIKTKETKLDKLKEEFDTVRKNIHCIKRKLQSRVSEITKTDVTIFGEIDNI